MTVQGRLLLQPILAPAWPRASSLWSRSDSGRITICVSGPLSLELVVNDEQTTWAGLDQIIPLLDSKDEVTALVALDYQQSWRVLLGFDSGIIVVLDSNRTLLFCHVLHRDRVLGFCCRSLLQGLHRPDIIIRYQDRIVFLDGSSFADTCNRQVDDELVDDEPEKDPLRYVQFHKVSVAGQININDVIFCNVPISIERMLSPNPHRFQFISVGAPSFNMIALAECDRRRPANEIIAVAVRQGVDAARKLASNLFAFGKKILIENSDEAPSENIPIGNVTTPKTLIENASTHTITPLATIGDVPNRVIQSIVDDDSHEWAACVDNLGRILLLDLRQFLFVRIWKGYRDAQIAFLRGDNQRHLMLLVYVSNLELLELWELPFGKRITARNIGKGHCLRPHISGPLLLASDGTALFHVSLDVNFSGLWRNVKTTIENNESRESVAASIERVVRADKTVTLDSVIHATLGLQIASAAELERHKLVSAAFALLQGNDKLQAGGLDVACLLLAAFIEFGSALLKSNSCLNLSFENVFMFAARSAPCTLDLARAVFDPLTLGLNDAVSTFIHVIELQESRLSECYLMWYWNAPVFDATNVFATEQACLDSIQDSTDIERALRLTEHFVTSTGPNASWAPVVSQLSDISIVQSILKESSVLCVAVKFSDISHAPVGYINAYLGFVLTARINDVEDRVTDEVWDIAVSNCIEKFQDRIDHSCIFLQCAHVLFNDRRNLTQCIRLLQLFSDDNVYKLAICAAIWRSITENLFPICFPSPETSKAVNLHFKWDDALALGDIILHLIPSKSSECNISLEEIQSYCVLFRCARLCSSASVLELGSLFPDSVLGKPINLACTNDAKVARRDFILSKYSDTCGNITELLQLASDLRVEESVMRSLTLQLMKQSPAHCEVISYLQSRVTYIPALGAELTQRLHLLLVEIIASLRSASNSRSKQMSKQAKTILSEIPDETLARLESETAKNFESNRKNRSISAIGSFTAESLTFGRSLLGYVSLAPSTDSEVNNDRVHEINWIVEALAAVNDAIIHQIGR